MLPLRLNTPPKATRPWPQCEEPFCAHTHTQHDTLLFQARCSMVAHEKMSWLHNNT